MIRPRDDVALMEGYHSPQLDVTVRLNTNESPEAPPPQWVGELARAVHACRARRHRLEEDVAAEARHDRRDAGVVGVRVRVADADAGDVGDRVRGPGRQQADPDAGLARPHARFRRS